MRDTLEHASPARIARRPTRPQLIKGGVTAVLLLFVFFALPELLSLYYVDTMTQVAVYSIVTLALGLLVGRVGLYSLGQAAVLAIQGVVILTRFRGPCANATFRATDLDHVREHLA